MLDCCHTDLVMLYFFFFFQAEDGIRDVAVTGVQTCALPISPAAEPRPDRDGEPYFGAGEDARRQHVFHALPQDPLGGGSLKFQAGRQPRREFEQPVVEERPAAFDRGGPCPLCRASQTPWQGSPDS